MDLTDEDIMKKLGWWECCNDDAKALEIRDRYLLTEAEQDKAVILFLEELSQRGKYPLSEKTKEYATKDALCAAQFFKAYRVLYEKWCK